MLDLKETEAQMASSDQPLVEQGRAIAGAYGILHKAEHTLHLLSLACRDAQSHQVPSPATPQDYLAWFVYEADQLVKLAGQGREAAANYQRASAILFLCAQLAGLEIQPSLLVHRAVRQRRSGRSILTHRE